jgi:hypothetical protein
MDDFDFYRLYKTLHVLAVMLMAGGIAIESVIGPLMAKAPSVQELRAYARLSRMAGMFLIAPGALFTAGFGYATAGRGDIDVDETWLLISQVIFYIAVFVGIGFLMQASRQLWNHVKDLPDGPVPAAVRSEAANPLPAILGGMLTIGFIFIVYLMVAQPAW